MEHAKDSQDHAFEQYRKYLLAFANMWLDPRLRPKLGASDVVQDTLLEFSEKEDSEGRNEGEIKALLLKMLACNLADELRRFSCDKRDIGRERSMEEAVKSSSARLSEYLADDQESPSQQAMRKEEEERLANALAALTEAQREAVVLQKCHGMSLAEIGDLMNLSTAAVAGLIKRGVNRLRSLLDESEEQ